MGERPVSGRARPDLSLDLAASLGSRGSETAGFAAAAAAARQLLSRQGREPTLDTARTEGRALDTARTERTALSVTPSKDDVLRCRFCFGGSEDGELIAPCSCDG